MVHKMFRAKIDEAHEELAECDPYITTLLAEAGAMVGKELGAGMIDARKYEEKMEEVKKLAGRFHSECSCAKRGIILPRVLPTPKVKEMPITRPPVLTA